MKVGVFTAVYNDRSFDEMLDKLAGLGVEALELGTGNTAADKHVGMEELLADHAKAAAFRRRIEERGMVISALSSTATRSTPTPSWPRATTPSGSRRCSSPSCSRSRSSTPSPAAPAAAPATGTPTGSRARGRTTSRGRWRGSGTRC